MDWIAKFRHLETARGLNLAGIERAAGWSANSLATALSRGSTPSAVAGVRLAQVLQVPADWLFDDTQGLPEPAALRIADDLLDAAIARVMNRRGLVQPELAP